MLAFLSTVPSETIEMARPIRLFVLHKDILVCDQKIDMRRELRINFLFPGIYI